MAQFLISSNNTNVDIYKLKLELETNAVVSCKVISIKPNNTGVIVLIDANVTTSENQINQLKTLVDNHNNTQRRRILVQDLPDGPDAASNSEYVDSTATNFLDDAKEYTDTKIADLVNSAPAVLDTLKELSDALGGDENFATTVSNRIGSAEDGIETLEARPNITNLDAISDVEIFLPVNNQALQYVSGVWQNKTLAEVALTNQYNDLTGKPNLSTAALSGSYTDLLNKPNLSTVALSGSYNDLLDKPSLFSGAYEDLSGTPTASAFIPAGILTPFAGTSAPDGWIICDGGAISRTTFADLFDVIGTTYGAGNGSTTFNIPDLRSRVPIGKGTTVNNALGSTDGIAEASRSLTHNHSVTVAGHFHDMSGAGSTLSTNIAHTHASSSVSGTITISTYDLSHSHDGTTGTESQGHTHSGSTGWQSANHSHSGTTGGHSADHTHYVSGTTNTDGAHNHLMPSSRGTAVSSGSSGKVDKNNGSTDSDSGTVDTGTSSSTHAHEFAARTEGASANHTHNFSTGGVSADHYHDFSTNGASASHNHTFSTTSTTMTNASNSLNHNHTATPSLTSAGQTLATTNVAAAGRIGKVTGGVDGNSDQTVTSTSKNNVNYVIMNYIIKT
jgi:microcystin-dependent protein